MATTKKNSKKVKRKPGLLAKIKAIIPRKKATTGRAYKNALAAKKSTRLNPAIEPDPAHAPGHRHLGHKASVGGKKNRAQDDASLNNVTRSERIGQQEINQRRMTNGVSVNKQGRRG